MLGRPAAGVSVHCALSWTFAYLSPGEEGLEKTHGTIFKFHIYWFSSAFACCFLIFLQPGKCLVQNLYPNQSLFPASDFSHLSLAAQYLWDTPSAPHLHLWPFCERKGSVPSWWDDYPGCMSEMSGGDLPWIQNHSLLETADSSGASIQAVFFPPWNLHRISL